MLDFLRFISAVIVFLYHFGLNVPGYQSVMVFFVLSGYFISLSVLKDVQQGTWNWIDYLIKRLVRLLVVLIPALVLTYVWAKVQIHFFGGEEYFSGVLDLKTLVGNLLFLQSIEVQQFGLNGPLWSLSYEFWYYILFPCIVLAIFSKKTYLKVVYALLFVLISLFVGKQIMMYFVIWLLGAAIALIKPKKLKSTVKNYSIFVIGLVVALLSTKGLYIFYSKSFNWQNPHYIPDISVGICFAFLIYWITVLFNEENKITKYNLSKKLAGFSYTLYLVHYPLLYIWRAMITSDSWTYTVQETYYVKLGYVLLIMLYAYGLGLITENKTGVVTKKVMGWKIKVIKDCKK